MVCSKCGNALEVGDVFCSKCGTKVGVAAAPAQGGGAAVKKTISKPALKTGLKLPGKKVLVVPAQKRKPMPLVVNGLCRYCGRRLGASATVCPDCGATGESQISPDNPHVRENRPVTMEDVKRAAELGQSLGEESSSSFFIGHGLLGDSFSGCLFVPFLLLNPLFWVQWIYRQKARNALERGDLDLAQKLKSTSTKFAIAWWIVIFAIFGILYLWLTNSH